MKSNMDHFISFEIYAMEAMRKLLLLLLLLFIRFEDNVPFVN